jgi:hypothetical protein
MGDRDEHPTPSPSRCARCARLPRDADDRMSWVTIDDNQICPGCLTLSDRDRLPDDER